MMMRPTIVSALVLAMLLAVPGVPDARRYRGERIDVFTGQRQGRWIIRTKERDGGQTLRTIVRCRPRRKCRPFPGRLRMDLQPGVDQFSWTGTFTLAGISCTLDTYAYEFGFEGTYGCQDGSAGSISGRSGRR